MIEIHEGYRLFSWIAAGSLKSGQGERDIFQELARQELEKELPARPFPPEAAYASIDVILSSTYR